MVTEACNTKTKHVTMSMCICEKCGTKFAGQKHNANKYCSYECYHESRWPKAQRKYVKVDGVWFKSKCIDCGKLIKHQNARRCMSCYEKTVTETKPFFTNKITRGKYVNLHRWVYQTLGQPSICWHCNYISKNPRQFHWANVSGEYKREISDWARLCATCHKNYDNGKLELDV